VAAAFQQVRKDAGLLGAVPVVEKNSIDSPVEPTRTLLDILVALPATQTIFLFDPMGVPE